MKDKTYGQVVGLILALVLLCAFCSGCTSMDTPPPCEPTTVTDYEKPTKLPEPEEPDWKLDEVTTAAEWRAWAEAIGLDFGSCQDWGAALQKVIRDYNRTVDSMPETPVPG